MGNDRVDMLLNSTLAGKLTKTLAAKQDNQEKSIKANIWNDFVAKIKIGNCIKNEISLENAMNSITKYAVVEAHKQNRSANDIAREWFDLMGLEISTPKKEDVSIDETESAQLTTNQPEIDPECEEAILGEDGQWCVKRYESGKLFSNTYYNTDCKTIDYLEEFSQETGKIEKMTQYNDNMVEFVNIHDEDGKWIKQEAYRPDGTLKTYKEYDPEQTGKLVYQLNYAEDGKTITSIE